MMDTGWIWFWVLLWMVSLALVNLAAYHSGRSKGREEAEEKARDDRYKIEDAARQQGIRETEERLKHFVLKGLR